MTCSGFAYNEQIWDWSGWEWGVRNESEEDYWWSSSELIDLSELGIEMLKNVLSWTLDPFIAFRVERAVQDYIALLIISDFPELIL